MSKKVSDILPKTEILAQVAEEASELAQAALKLRWPAYEKMYISSFERMLNIRKVKGLQCDWQSGMDVFRWWMEDDNVNGQLSMDDLMEDNNV